MLKEHVDSMEAKDNKSADKEVIRVDDKTNGQKSLGLFPTLGLTSAPFSSSKEMLGRAWSSCAISASQGFK
jgi:hypothetical protein